MLQRRLARAEQISVDPVPPTDEDVFKKTYPKFIWGKAGENTMWLFNEDRLLMVFPEGARGTAKLYVERYNLVRFGTGFMRLALATKTPIVPFGSLGGGEALPTVSNMEKLGRLIGAAYIPLPPYLLPVPLPVRMEVPPAYTEL